MNGNCHFILGMGISASAMLLTEPDINAASGIAALVLLGSIFPDIDNPTSHFGQLTKPVSSIIGKLGDLAGHSRENHRGVFHDVFLYGGGFILCMYYELALLWFFIGTLGHLLLDSMTKAGIPIILGMGRFRIGKLKSGDKGSIIMTWILTVLIISGSVYYNLNCK